MIEQHYDEEVLIALLDEEKPDAHLESCGTCKSALDSIRSVTAALHDATVWDRRELSEEPVPATRDALRSFASAVAAEDAEAAPWVKALLARPADEWQGMVDRHPEWRTAGFVRGLTREAVEGNYRDALRSLAISGFAAELADRFDCSRMHAASTAWREFAYALYYVGRYPDAMKACERAVSFLEDGVAVDHAVARLQLLRSYVLAATQEWRSALNVCREASAVFEAYGDRQRVLTSQLFESSILIRTDRFADALPLLVNIWADTSNDAVVRGCAAEHAAVCSRELGNLDESRRFFAQAIELFTARRELTRVAVVKRQLARTFVAEGRYEEAHSLFLSLCDEFRENGMLHDLALASVDAAETLLLLGREENVVELCSAAINFFGNISLSHGRAALTALAFMREAAQKKTLTPSVVQEVRIFFEMLPKQPELLFVAPM